MLLTPGTVTNRVFTSPAREHAWKVNEELKLGFLRLGQWLEDPVNMALALIVAWVIVLIPVVIGLGLGLPQVFLLLFAGVALAVLLRRPIVLAAGRLRRLRLELEERREPISDGA